MKTKLAGICLMALFGVFVLTALGHAADLRLAEPLNQTELGVEPPFIPEEILKNLILVQEQSNDCAYAKKVALSFVKAENGIIVFQGTIVGKFEQPGDVDWFEFDNGWTWGIINVSTTGSTDTSGELYPNCQSAPTFVDDNSGEGDNFSINAGMAGTGT